MASRDQRYIFSPCEYGFATMIEAEDELPELRLENLQDKEIRRKGFDIL
jgi:hypothetical protein